MEEKRWKRKYIFVRFHIIFIRTEVWIILTRQLINSCFTAAICLVTGTRPLSSCHYGSRQFECLLFVSHSWRFSVYEGEHDFWLFSATFWLCMCFFYSSYTLIGLYGIPSIRDGNRILAIYGGESNVQVICVWRSICMSGTDCKCQYIREIKNWLSMILYQTFQILFSCLKAEMINLLNLNLLIKKSNFHVLILLWELENKKFYTSIKR